MSETPVVDEYDVSPRWSAGELIAPGYEVIAHLHQSDDLDVYDVLSEERNCRCIAKVLRQDRLDYRRARRRLLYEGRLLQRFTHPHIVRAYETLTRPDPVLILETLTGATLEHLLDERRQRLALVDVVFLGLHLCSAMHYLHRHGILHLDLKPSNIVSDRGMAKVLDLSIARSPGRGSRGLGTPQYMSPEQARGDFLSEATDVWGIGVVLFEAATGRRAFDSSDTEAEYEQLERRAEPVRSLRRVPAAFATAVDSCLDPDPARRPTVDELYAILNEFA